MAGLGDAAAGHEADFLADVVVAVEEVGPGEVGDDVVGVDETEKRGFEFFGGAAVVDGRGAEGAGEGGGESEVVEEACGEFGEGAAEAVSGHPEVFFEDVGVVEAGEHFGEGAFDDFEDAAVDAAAHGVVAAVADEFHPFTGSFGSFEGEDGVGVVCGDEALNVLLRETVYVRKGVEEGGDFGEISFAGRAEIEKVAGVGASGGAGEVKGVIEGIGGRVEGVGGGKGGSFLGGEGR